jgi:anthranilate synthase component 1
VSKSGQSYALRNPNQEMQFLALWRDNLSFTRVNFPTLQSIFYLAYEAGALFEALPEPKQGSTNLLVWRHLPEWSICFDAEQGMVYLSSTQSEDDLDMLEHLLQTSAVQAESNIAISDIDELVFDYKKAVDKVKDYISAGDIFQANIARFWSANFAQESLLSLYNKLREVNPAPFSCFLEMDDLSIVSASPERLFSISSDNELSARPIAGTRKRSDGDADNLLMDELLLSEKERAEHIMLVDLERNDLGRVCELGSIHVDECMVIEKYATVQHIVSNVRGKLAQGHDLLDVLAAKFPGGTITGCPKVRCMEIIHELEPQTRGPYTGGIGYMAWDGSVDMNILIRTFWHTQGKLHWAAGAGIVADSVPAHEEVETEHKVEGLLRAIR